MTKDGKRRVDLQSAKRAVQGIIHDPNHTPDLRQRARLAVVRTQKLIDSANEE